MKEGDIVRIISRKETLEATPAVPDTFKGTSDDKVFYKIFRDKKSRDGHLLLELYYIGRWQRAQAEERDEVFKGLYEWREDDLILATEEDLKQIAMDRFTR